MIKPSKKVVICTLFLGNKPTEAFIRSLSDSEPYLRQAGLDVTFTQERNCPYISQARSKVLGRAIRAGADSVIFIDYDIAWRPQDLLKLIQTEGDVIAGTYRVKTNNFTRYMGLLIPDEDGRPIVREDGCVEASHVPAGFLKISRTAVDVFAKAYPELLYGFALEPNIDLFNHGAIDGIWHGEDYAFCHRWRAIGGKIWIIPDMNIDHYFNGVCHAGNFHQHLKSGGGLW